MCDEYDDERMRAFWRLVDERQRLATAEPEPEEAPEPIVKPLTDLGGNRRQKILTPTR